MNRVVVGSVDLNAVEARISGEGSSLSKVCDQVFNLVEFNQRAVSLHIYSRPFDRCLVYSTETGEYREIPLHYTSEYGKLCEGERL